MVFLPSVCPVSSPRSLLLVNHRCRWSCLSCVNGSFRIDIEEDYGSGLDLGYRFIFVSNHFRSSFAESILDVNVLVESFFQTMVFSITSKLLLLWYECVDISNSWICVSFQICWDLQVSRFSLSPLRQRIFSCSDWRWLVDYNFGSSFYLRSL